MASNKKPAKKYTPKEVVHPLNIRNAWATEGGVYVALMMMESGCSLKPDHVASLGAYADLIRRVVPVDSAPHRQAQSLLRMVSTICDRPELRVTPAEELPIRAAVQATMPVLHATSNLKILRAAKQSLVDQTRWGGMRLEI